VATACDYMAVRFGTLSSDFLCGLISGASRTCAWITRSVRRRAASFSRANRKSHEKKRASISPIVACRFGRRGSREVTL